MPIYTWCSQPILNGEFVSNEIVSDEFVAEEFVMDEGLGLVVAEPVVYQEQLVWTGCNWQLMLVAVPEFQGDQFVYQEGDVHTVGRTPYLDSIEGEVISDVPDDTSVPVEDSIDDLIQEPIDQINAEDDFDDGDPKDGDSEKGNFEDDDGLADK